MWKSSILLLWLSLAIEGQVFTVQVGQRSSIPTPLVNHSDPWHYRRGTNAPPADWRTAADELLDESWRAGPGGFGYGDGDDATVLADQRNNYFTVSIRRSFKVDSPVDSSRRLRLTVDYDDGFIAYLDGKEIARSSNVPGPPGTPHPFNQGVSPDHEARGYQRLSAEVFDLGPVGDRLAPGAHILAVQGINGTLDSSDSSLIVDLELVSAEGAVGGGPLLSIVQSDSIALHGTNTLAGSAKVLVDGAEAQFNPAERVWTYTAALKAGYNRFLIQATDGGHVPMSSVYQTIIGEFSSTSVGGPLTAETVWSPSMGIIRVTAPVLVPARTRLTIEPGTVVLLRQGASLRTAAGGTIEVNGTEANIVCFGPADGAAPWGQILAEGTNSFLTVRHAEVVAGAVQGGAGSTCLIEDSYLHHYKAGISPIAGCDNAASMVVRRCHFSFYHETLWRSTPVLIEDSLFENADDPSGDALDFDTAPLGSTIRRCTFRHGPRDNSDAVDLGSGTKACLIEDSWMYDFPNDKGVSVGENSSGVEIRNSLITDCDSGVAVKDNSVATLHDCTIVGNLFGLRNFNKACETCDTGGGHIPNSWNNIVWGNLTNISMLNGSTLNADHSVFGNPAWPGTGNQEADPRFRNAAQGDFRLVLESPVISAGRDGTIPGAKFPVGAPMALSHPRIDSVEHKRNGTGNGPEDVIRFWVDSERSYSLESSAELHESAWTKVADLFPHPLPRKVAVTNAVAGGTSRFYRLVTPRR
ncbi:MAG: right-handed parallel beta-helix repeat-containing protein [Verrucomicrobia bacterium]|nr:right-handed parallel beta-helix repeat-containing protein [Verrucomicrobiota bacterium]